MIERPMYPRMALALLALVGLFDAAYLSITHFQASTAITCPVTGDGCTQVRDSIWSVLPPGEQGIPIALLGVLGYALIFAGSMLALHRDTIRRLVLPLALVVLGSLGVVFSLYLVSLQLFVIQAVCSWCMLSALLMTTICVTAVYDWRTWEQHKANQQTQAVVQL